jgi:hypothetical protein
MNNNVNNKNTTAIAGIASAAKGTLTAWASSADAAAT